MAHVFGFSVDADKGAVCTANDTEFRRQYHAIAAIGDRSSDEFFVVDILPGVNARGFSQSDS
ncbi:hypothetical protein CKA32_002534 [Geitlerinema sp. FC II]|nr:hypothetical protein CKA32_002534 [Geitlerinema sp. FC II]